MPSMEEAARALVLMQAATLPRWERIAIWVREYAAACDVSDHEWLNKTRAYLEQCVSDLAPLLAQDERRERPWIER